jgi:hypothetical protein
MFPLSRRQLALTAAFSLVALASPALARDVYECNFPEVSNNLGYLPTLVVMSPNPDGVTATVVDGIIQAEKGGPIEVDIADENARKLSVSWAIMLQSSGNDYVKVAYRLSIQKSGLAASLTGRAQGYTNVFTAQGKCARKKA